MEETLLLHCLHEQRTDAFDKSLACYHPVCNGDKTRTLYAWNFGLFFVVNNHGNGGSKDFGNLVEDVAKRGVTPYRWLLIQACCQYAGGIFERHWMANYVANRHQLRQEIIQLDDLSEELLLREADIPPVRHRASLLQIRPRGIVVYATRPLAKPVLTGFTLYDMFTDVGGWSDATQMVESRGILQVDERAEKIITNDIYPRFYGMW
ncbi:hypothetical protein SELMODRAFT_410821 [Selaginella moellendorffii]|uniref:Uncharacterized protein n=1 Tax=Selaginella moellendorffii TaxID=88036 RepID=D8RFZ2_SELML|nr:hypothetical protein SELMODRAFT_410821 [Selaginella moellendorffii]